MKTKILYVLVADPLFLGKKNLGAKIFQEKGIIIEYLEEKDHVLIKYNGETARIKHYSAIVEVPDVQAKVAPPLANGKIKAQVWTPQDHVFAEGPGKVKS